MSFALAPQAMPARLREWAQRAGVETDSEVDPDPAIFAADVREILAKLKQSIGHDFSSYRQRTILRRIERRRMLHGLESLQAYLARLDADPEEHGALFQALRVGTTAFFRDPDIFAELEAALAARLADRSSDDPVRVWVPACSTGEEAYSVAMLVQEAIERLGVPLPFQLFASDIDEQAIQRARRGEFAESVAAEVSSGRRERFFRRDWCWTIESGLRGRIAFAVHDLLVDAPYVRMDLISCKNLLVDLDAEARRRALALLHYALRPGGLLVLGKTESTETLEGAFAPFEPFQRIHQRIDAPAPRMVERIWPTPRPAPRIQGDLPFEELRPARATGLERWLAEVYAPAAVLVTARGDILHVHGRTGELLELPTGRVQLNVLELARDGLRAAIAAVLAQIEQHPKETAAREVRIPGHAGPLDVRVVGYPLPRQGLRPGDVVICFEPSPARARSRGKSAAPSQDAARLAELEADLRRTRADLHHSIDGLQGTNEELVSRNEELQSTNDELLDANHVLAISRSEVQALNARLQLTNSELQKVEGQTRQALLRTRALLDAALDGVLGVDLYGTIELVNPALCTLFGYEAHEIVGASLTVLVPALQAPEAGAHGGSPLPAATAQGLELMGRRRSGSTFPIRLSLVEAGYLGRRILVGTVRDLRAERQLRRSLRRETRAAVRAEEFERRKLASELHDDLGQTLALACMKLAALRRTPEWSGEIESVERLIRQAVGQMESLTSQLSPPALHDLGLVPAIEWLAEDVERRYRLPVEVADDRSPKPLEEVTRVALFWAVRELLTDAARHAGVTRAVVHIARERRQVRIEVVDDGVAAPDQQDRGLDLALVRERLRNLDGKLQLESIPGEGTRALVEVPLQPERESDVEP